MSRCKFALALLLITVVLSACNNKDCLSNNYSSEEADEGLIVPTMDSIVPVETAGADYYDTAAEYSDVGSALQSGYDKKEDEKSIPERYILSETQSNTKPNSSPSGNISVKTTAAATKVQTTTKAQPATLQPTKAPPQPTTAVPQQPTQAPQPTAAPQPTVAPTQAKPAYNPDYVIAETTRQLKELGYECIPEYLDRYLVEGRITQEEYDAWYPTDGAGWFECSLYNVTFGLTIDDDVNELVGSCEYLCVDNIFYIEYIGENEYGGYTFRVYR